MGWYPQLFPDWGTAGDWLLAHPAVGRRTLPADFDLAFVSGAPWPEGLGLGEIEVVFFRYDAATGRYTMSRVTYGD